MKYLFLSTLFAAAVCIILSSADAQWVQTSGPTGSGGNVNCLAASGTNLFAGTFGGVFLSTNSGAIWTAANTGLTDTVVHALLVSGTDLWAGTNVGVFRSTNNGTSWTANLILGGCRALGKFGTILYAGIYPIGIYASTDNGASWFPDTMRLTSVDVRAFAANGTNFFAGTYDRGVFLETVGGWAAVNTGLTDTTVYALGVIGTNLFAGTSYNNPVGPNGHVFRTTNSGTNWTVTSYASVQVEAFAASGTNLFAGNNVDGVYLSTNNGTSWTRVSPGLAYPHVDALAVSGTNLFAGSTGLGVWRRPLSEMITSVEEGGPRERPNNYSLQQNYPNPFNPTTNISYQLTAVSFVTLKVFDLFGREVSTLVNDQLMPGEYTVTFDASLLAGGTYFYRLTAGAYTETKKLLLLK